MAYLKVSGRIHDNASQLNEPLKVKKVNQLYEPLNAKAVPSKSKSDKSTIRVKIKIINVVRKVKINVAVVDEEVVDSDEANYGKKLTKDIESVK